MLGSRFEQECPICRTPYRFTGEPDRYMETQYQAVVERWAETSALCRKLQTKIDFLLELIEIGPAKDEMPDVLRRLESKYDVKVVIRPT